MRAAALALVTSITAFAQFRATTPLVVSPVTVTDAKGHYIDGLTADDLILYDNSVRQRIQMDWTSYPISLVVAVQTSSNSGTTIDKLGRTGLLFSQLLAADAGETAMISFSDEVKHHQEFTKSEDELTHSLRMLRKEGSQAHMLDALREASAMLTARPPQQRKIVLMIAERRDRSSRFNLSEVMEAIQRANITVYWLTWSPFLESYTAKPRTMEDLKPEAERIKEQPGCALCPKPDDRGVPADIGPGGTMYAIEELFRLKQPDLSNLFTRTTGGRSLMFVKKGALEQAIQLIGEEVHRQYVLTFQPAASEPGEFHSIWVEVKGRPELRVTARQGYWAVQ